MSDRIDLTEFNALAVVRFFDYTALTPLQRRAMEFTFERESASEFNQGAVTAEKRRAAVACVIEKIQYSLETFNLYSSLIAPQSDEKRLAGLGIAVICDEHTFFINEPVRTEHPIAFMDHHNDNDTNPVLHDDGFNDDEAVHFANLFQDEAVQMCDEGLYDEDEPEPESIVLAHIHARKFVRDLNRDFLNYDDETLLSFLANDLHHFESFIETGTVWGDDLDKELEEIQDRIVEEVIGLKAHPVIKVFENPAPLPQ